MKTFRLNSVLIILLLLQAGTKVPNDNAAPAKSFNIIEINTNLKSDIDSLAFIINNESFDLNSELKNLEKLSPSPEKIYLISLLYKRGGNYMLMYDTLYNGLQLQPSFIQYFNELSFAARAAGKDSLLQTHISIYDIEPVFKNFLLGQLRSAKNDHKSALEYYLASVKYDSTNPHIIFEIAAENKNLGNYKKSLDYLDKCEFLSSHNKYFLPKIKIAKGTLYYLSGDFDKAKMFYKAAESLCSDINDNQNLTSSLVDLGIISDVSSNIDAARNYYSRALNLAAKINYTEGEAYASSELGVSFTFTNELIEAKHYYLRSYALYKELGNKLRLSLLSDNIGKIYMAMFDFPAAQKYYSEGLQYAGDNNRAQVLNLIGLADIYTNLSNYGKALEYYKKASKLSSQVKELELTAEINNSLGIINYNLRNYGNALKYFSSSEDLVSQESKSHYQQGDYIYKCALSYLELDSLAKADEYFSKALILSKKLKDTFLEANVLTDAALLQFKKGNPSTAGLMLSEGISLAKKNGYKIALARLYLLSGDYAGSFTSSKNDYENALHTSTELNNFDLMIQSYASLGKLCYTNNLPELASTYYQSAISLMEDVGRPLFQEEDIQIKYFSSNQDIYSGYAEMLLKNQQYEKAFLMIDRSKSQNMIQNLNNLKLQELVKDKSKLERLYEYEWMIHSGLYKKSLDSLKDVYTAYKKDLTAKDLRIGKYLNLSPKNSIEDYKRDLGPDENILSLYTTSDLSVVFIMNRNAFYTFPLHYGKKQLNDLLKKISPYYASDNENDNTFFNQDLFSYNSEASNNFYNIFLKEPLSKVEQNGRLIIIPSLETVYLPFEILVTERRKDESPYVYKNIRYLLADYSISYTPSLAAFIDQKGNDLKNSNKSLVLGNPSINTNSSSFSERRGLLEDKPGIPRNISLLPLKYSKEEVKEVGDIISADKIFTERNATETNFKRNADFSKIIHLSTHSFLIRKQPVIFFSNVYDPENDGFLEASEIARMNLNSDLVVLSSCKSGLGEIDESEGVLGMTKAFFEAGTKSIIVSLWEVNDKYTSKLMALFYEKLRNGLDKGEALRQAKQQFITEYSPNPYYWGAFVLSGNTGRLVLKQNTSLSWYWIAVIILFAIAGFYYLLKRFQTNNPVRVPYQDQPVS